MHHSHAISRAVILIGLLLIAAAVLSGCMSLPTSVRTELEHVSHPLAGWPVSAADAEDGLSQLNLLAEWQVGERGYVQHGLGWNLQGENGGGFFGPELTYSLRVGVELWSRERSAR